MFTVAVIPAPDPLPLPSAPWLLWFLMMLTWVLHVVAMNLVLGGSIIALVARLRAGQHEMRLAQAISKLLPTMVAATVTFGVAPLLFVQALYGRLFFPSAVLMAWWWFAVIPILILAYYGTYALSIRGEKLGRAANVIAGFVALLFLTISFIYSNNMTMMLRPQGFLGKYLQNAGGVQLNLGDATLFPRWLHMVLGAMAVAGMIVAIYGLVERKRDEAYGAWTVQHGARWFIFATALNVVAGLWWMMALPRDVLLRFMGRSTAGSILFIVGFFLAIGALAMTVSTARAGSAGALKPAAFTLLLTLVFMALMRDEVRRGMMQLADYRLTDRIAPQWDVIALFLILLVAALATTIWMAVMLLRPHVEAEAQTPAAKPSQPATA